MIIFSITFYKNRRQRENMNRKILELVFRNRIEKRGKWCGLHRRMLKYGDETITYKINEQEAEMPFAFSGVLFSEENPNYDRQLGRICKYVREKLNRPINIIDVGANIGDTVLNIGDKDNKYLLVEGEASYNRYIEKNLKGYDYELETVFCAESDDDGKSKVVVKDHGTAKVVEDSTGSDINTKTMDRIIAEHSFEPDVFKIDTDGFDFKVMRGAGIMLETYKPVIFFEWTLEELEGVGENPTSIFGYLSSKGYNDLVLFDNYGDYFCIIDSSKTELLEDIIEYTRNENIHYFDVCAVHKDSCYSVEEIKQITRINR